MSFLIKNVIIEAHKSDCRACRPEESGVASRWADDMNEKSDHTWSLPSLSGYSDSNTGPSGPKPDALANCATPR